MLGNKFRNLYSNYYSSNNFTKREITASQTMNHIKNINKEIRPKRVLDVGAGEGSLLEQMTKHDFADELYAVEISESGIKAIKGKNITNLIEVLSFDGYKIPYPDKYFDLATCIHVLEHVEHERQFLAELKRVSHSCIIEVPLEHTIKISKAIEIGNIYGHINFYTPETFKNLLSTSGIEVKSLKVFSNDKELECFLSGNLKGPVKWFFKKTALNLMPKLSTYGMTYLCIAHCSL